MKKQNDKILSCCPVCNAMSQIDFLPFCSKRCANHDLLKWLNGEYYIPGKELVAIEHDDTEDDNIQ